MSTIEPCGRDGCRNKNLCPACFYERWTKAQREKNFAEAEALRQEADRAFWNVRKHFEDQEGH